MTRECEVGASEPDPHSNMIMRWNLSREKWGKWSWQEMEIQPTPIDIQSEMSDGETLLNRSGPPTEKDFYLRLPSSYRPWGPCHLISQRKPSNSTISDPIVVSSRQLPFVHNISFHKFYIWKGGAGIQPRIGQWMRLRGGA